MTATFRKAMTALPLVAILRGITAQEVDAAGDALVSAGFRLIEVPLTVDDAFESIARLVKRFGSDVVVGAGTVRTEQQLDLLIQAGGQLMVTPHADVTLIREAKSRGLATLPGVMTPTEAFAAIDAGADALKLFPAEILPPSATRALRTVIGAKIPLCPTGGIEPSSMADHITAGASGFGLGGGLYRPGQPSAEIEVRAHAFVSAWKALSSNHQP